MQRPNNLLGITKKCVQCMAQSYWIVYFEKFFFFISGGLTEKAVAQKCYL